MYNFKLYIHKKRNLTWYGRQGRRRHRQVNPNRPYRNTSWCKIGPTHIIIIMKDFNIRTSCSGVNRNHWDKKGWKEPKLRVLLDILHVPYIVGLYFSLTRPPRDKNRKDLILQVVVKNGSHNSTRGHILGLTSRKSPVKSTSQCTPYTSTLR